MTVDEAIICLSDMKIKVAIPKAAVQARLNNDALDMAIEALKCSEIPNSSDTISRQQAIDALKTDMASLDHIIKGMSAYDVRLDAYVSQRNQVNYDIYTINNLPTAQPERKTGHWIKTARWGRVYYCDQCRNYLDFDGVNAGRGSTNFCPNCGADMREGEQE